MMNEIEKAKRTYHIDTLLTQDEYERITLKADMYGIKKSQYMRRVALGYPLPPCRADQRVLQELVRTHANINRLGGILKLYIVSNKETKASLGNKSYSSIEQLVDDIEDTSKKILEISERLL